MKNSRKKVTYLHTDNKDGNYMFADGFQEGSNTFVDEFKEGNNISAGGFQEGSYMSADGFQDRGNLSVDGSQDGINVSVTTTRIAFCSLKVRACCSVMQNRKIKLATAKKIQLR